jgi:predicted metal-binding membrane protein
MVMRDRQELCHSRFYIYILLTLYLCFSYLAIWTIIGIILLLAWSVPVNDSLAHFQQSFGIVLIISGVYQFSLLKRKCIGYCESPKNFFMRRWSNEVYGAMNMGVHCAASGVVCPIAF